MTSFSILSFIVIRGPHEEQILNTLLFSYHIILLGVLVNMVLGPAGMLYLFSKSNIRGLAEWLISIP